MQLAFHEFYFEPEYGNIYPCMYAHELVGSRMLTPLLCPASDVCDPGASPEV